MVQGSEAAAEGKAQPISAQRAAEEEPRAVFRQDLQQGATTTATAMVSGRLGAASAEANWGFGCRRLGFGSGLLRVYYMSDNHMLALCCCFVCFASKSLLCFSVFPTF